MANWVKTWGMDGIDVDFEVGIILGAGFLGSSWLDKDVVVST